MRELSSKVAVVVVPRHQYGLTRACVESLYKNTGAGFELIALNSTGFADETRWLDDWARDHDNCQVVPIKKKTYPFEAKNIAIKQLPSSVEWVVFIDNDIRVEPQWLEHLLLAAKETGARVVHPLYIIQIHDRSMIHMAHGEFVTVAEHGRDQLDPVMQSAHSPASDADRHERCQSDFVEFHCWMMHKDLLEKMMPFEPLSIGEHVHFSLRLRKMGEKIVFEPKSVVTYVAVVESKEDRDYLRFRWNQKMALRSVKIMREAWPDLSETYLKSRIDGARHFRYTIEPWFPLFLRYQRFKKKIKSGLQGLGVFKG